MTITQLLISSGQLFEQILLKPSSVFERIADNAYVHETLIAAGIGALIPLFKSFTFGARPRMNFFADERLNNLFTLLGNPQLTLFIFYIFFIIYILFVFRFCVLFNKSSNLIFLLRSFLATSAVGCISQVTFVVFNYLIPQDWLVAGSWLVYLWMVALFVQAVKVTQHLAFLQAFVAVIIPAIIIVVIIGFGATAPYLAWLVL